MRTFIYYYAGVWRGAVMIIQAENRIKADKMFITDMLKDKRYAEDNLKWRECTGARVIDQEFVEVEEIPEGEEYLTILYDGDD